jgi:hypothetical protein
MKKLYVLIIAIVIVATGSVSAQTPAEAKTQENSQAGEFKFEKETWDFGEIVQGESVTHVFKFTNNGNEPIIITNSRGSCGCTTPQWPRESILPGETGEIKVKFNSTGKMGSQKKSVTLTSNAKTPTKVIYLTGKVLKPSTDAIPVKKNDGPAENKTGSKM